MPVGQPVPARYEIERQRVSEERHRERGGKERKRERQIETVTEILTDRCMFLTNSG